MKKRVKILNNFDEVITKKELKELKMEDLYYLRIKEEGRVEEEFLFNDGLHFGDEVEYTYNLSDENQVKELEEMYPIKNTNDTLNTDFKNLEDLIKNDIVFIDGFLKEWFFGKQKISEEIIDYLQSKYMVNDYHFDLEEEEEY